MGWEHENECPPYGAQPSWALVPSDYTLNSVIRSACATVIRKCRVQNALHFTEVDIASQTATGPFILRLDALPGFADGQVVRLRRSYWTQDSGVTFTRVMPVLLSQQDIEMSNWMNNGPGTPTQIAVEGMQIYVLPGPDTAGTLRMTVGSGCLAPLMDDEGYDGIPEAYDDAINYVALMELAAVLAGDAEMQKRLSVFAPFAAEGLKELEAWFDNAALEDFEPSANWETSVTRFSRRN